jgi:site-specific recombinase XerD
MRYIETRVPGALDQVHRIRQIPSKRRVLPFVRHLSMTEVRAVLDAPDPSTRSGIRDRAMLHLCFACGLRVSELIGLQVGSVSLGTTPSVHVVGKGRRERQLPLWRQTARDVRAWLAVRASGPARAPELFLNAAGEAMTRDGFEYILAKHARAAASACPSLMGRKVAPHQLRHSCAMVMLGATRDVRKVAIWLGHADTRTTEVYLRADSSEKLEAMEAVLPPELRRGRFRAADALIASLFGPDPRSLRPNS